MRFRVHRQRRPRAHLEDQHLTIHGKTEEEARQQASWLLEIPLQEVRLVHA